MSWDCCFAVVGHVTVVVVIVGHVTVAVVVACHVILVVVGLVPEPSGQVEEAAKGRGDHMVQLLILPLYHQ